MPNSEKNLADDDWRLGAPPPSEVAEPVAEEPSVQYTEHGYQLIDPEKVFDGDTGGTDLLGELSRAQWDRWMEQTAPTIIQLGQMATDSSLPVAASNQAMGAVGQSFDNARAGLKLTQARMGTRMGADEQRLQDRKFGLSEAAAKVDAANKARVASQDRQQQILAGSGGMQQLPDQFKNQ